MHIIFDFMQPQLIVCHSFIHKILKGPTLKLPKYKQNVSVGVANDFPKRNVA